MAWGGSGGQVDLIQKTGKATTERAADAHRNKPLGRKLSGPSEVKRVVVYSNKEGGDTVELTGGFINLRYHESLLSNTIRVTYTYTDSGNTTNNQKGGTNCKNTTTAVDGLPIVCLLYTSPSPRDGLLSRMPSSA